MPSRKLAGQALTALLLICAVAVLKAEPSLKPRYPGIVLPATEIAKYKTEVAALAGARVAERKACTLVSVEGHWAVYVFTKEGHPAHPAVYVLYAEEEHQGVSKRRVWGHTAGNQESFAKYLADARTPRLGQRTLLAQSCSEA